MEQNTEQTEEAANSRQAEDVDNESKHAKKSYDSRSKENRDGTRTIKWKTGDVRKTQRARKKKKQLRQKWE